MNYQKPALTVGQQISLLRERGMHFEDEVLAEHWLLHVNYYRLRANWLPLEDASAHPNHRFVEGTAFEQVIVAYEFDRELRLLLLDAVERIETSVRTQWAYHLAMRHGPFAHEQGAFYRDAARHEKRIAMLANEYRNSEETFAEHHRAGDQRRRPGQALQRVGVDRPHLADRVAGHPLAAAIAGVVEARATAA